ncbi:CoA ester lyase [Desulfovibrio sp. OttesenSCG-928-I05]|nr:CoA ester lyase [Desulfovibrio sp. OttesenSCG-928-I05]
MNRCRTMLFMPGNNPGMLASAGSLGADIVIFDLEDAVAQAEKDTARILVRNTLTYLKPATEVTVRINALDTPYWKDDIDAAIQGGAEYILAPKCAQASDVHTLMGAIEEAEARTGTTKKLLLIALIESALGVENAFALATSHPRLTGILLGAEDLTAELGAKRTAVGQEILYARSRIVMACRAAGIKALDTPFPFVTDLEGLAADAAFSAQLGFDGKAVISPHHVHAVNEAFSPTAEQVRWAERVMVVARRAKEEGKGAVSLDGMMIDLPIIKRAERILSRAADTTETCNA